MPSAGETAGRADEQIAPLRAQLARQSGEHQRLFGLLDQTAKKTGYRALVSAAFVIAAQRRFHRGANQAEVIEFVGDVRSRSDQVADQANPGTAERILMSVFTEQTLDDIDARTSWEEPVTAVHESGAVAAAGTLSDSTGSAEVTSLSSVIVSNLAWGLADFRHVPDVLD